MTSLRIDKGRERERASIAFRRGVSEWEIKMVVGVWEFVLFLWSHPIISCMVLLLFSPPFFPIIVYFSPLLICTGLVTIAMVSMNIGGSTGSQENLPDGTRHPNESVHVEMPLKAAKESWSEWIKKLEERAKAWVDGRFLNQEKWQFVKLSSYGVLQRDISAPVDIMAGNMQSLGNAVEYMADKSIASDGHRISRPEELFIPSFQHPSRNVELPIRGSSVFELDEGAKVDNDRSYPPMREREEIRPVSRKQCEKEVSLFEASFLEKQPAITVTMETEVTEDLQGKVLSNSRKMVEEHPREATGESVSVDPPLATPEDETLSHDAAFVYERRELSLENENVAKVASVPRPAEVLPSVIIDERAPVEESHLCFTKDVRAGEDSTLLKLAVSRDDFHSDTHRSGNSPFENVRREDPMDLMDFAAGRVPDSGPIERWIAAEKIIFVDEAAAVNNHSRGEQGSQIEVSLVQKESGGQKFAEGTELVPDGGLAFDLYENVEAYRDLGSTRPGVFKDSEPLALVTDDPTRTTAKGSEPTPLMGHRESTDDLRTDPSLPSNRSKSEVSHVAEGKFESLIPSPLYGAAFSNALTMMDGEQSTISSTTDEEDFGEVEPVKKFSALDQSLSGSARKREGPNSRKNMNVSSSTGIVLGFTPSTIKCLERGPFTRNLALSESQKRRPPIGTGAAESVEAITARLQKKYIQNWAKDGAIRMPKMRETTFRTSSMEKAIVPVSIDRNKRGEGTDACIASLDGSTVKNGVQTTPDNLTSKKSLSSFLSRQRERLPLLEAFSDVGASNILKRGSSSKAALTSAETLPAMNKSDERVVLVEGGDNVFVVRRIAEAFEATQARRGGSTSANAKDEGCGTQDNRRVEEYEDARTKHRGSTEVWEKGEGSTTPRGKLFKGKMMSPLKRVFSLDTSAVGNIAKKADGNKGTAAAKHSSAKEPLDKQSVKDKSKDKLKNIFSFDERGWSKQELAEVEKIAGVPPGSLKKSKSNSIWANGEQKPEIAVTAGECVKVSSPMGDPLPSEDEEHEIKNVTSVPEKALRRIESVFAHEAIVVDSDTNFNVLPAPASPAVLSPQTDEQLTAAVEGRGADESSAKSAPCRDLKLASERKFSLSWTKKKRSSEPSVAVGEYLGSAEEKTSSPVERDEKQTKTFMSPLRRFHSTSAVDSVGDADKAAVADVPFQKAQSLENRFYWLKSKHRESRKDVSRQAASPHKKQASGPWRTLKANLEEKSNRGSTSWWSRRPDSKATATAPDSVGRPTGDTAAETNDCSRIAATPQKSKVVPSWAKKRHKSENDLPMDVNNNVDRNVEDEATARSQWQCRGQSESPLVRGATKFDSRPERQTSFSSSTLLRPAGQSPCLSSGTVTNSLNPVSLTKTRDGFEDNSRHLPKEKTSDLIDNSNTKRRAGTAKPALYYTRTASAWTCLDLAQGPKNSSRRSDTDTKVVPYRNPPAVAEIRITNKLKVPLDEVLSLLSTGEKDDHHTTATANTAGGGGAFAYDRPQVPSSSSSEEEMSSISSDEEWSSASEYEDELPPPPQHKPQFGPLPPAARIRKKLPHYIFNRGEATAN